MDREDRKLMERYLPEYTRIAKTPDTSYSQWEDRDCNYIEIEFVDIKTRDIINAFMNLQAEAIHCISQERNRKRREEAMSRIRNMVFFDKLDF